MSALDRLDIGTPIVLLVQLHDAHQTEQAYYGHFYGVRADGEVELRYDEDDRTRAYFDSKDVLQVSPTTEEGLGQWGRKK